MINSTHILRRTLLGGVTAAALLASTPAASLATPIDPAVYDAGVPAGFVEHGQVELTISGSHNAQKDLTEYWLSNTGWRSVTRETSTGSVTQEGFGDARSTHYYNPLKDPSTRIVDLALPSPPPLAGWTAAYNKKLLQRGLLQSTGPVTIAGFAGTQYTVPDAKKTTGADGGGSSWQTDNPGAQTVVALEDGTDAPLMRQTTIAQSGGDYVQREELQTREVVPATPALLKPLTKEAEASTMKAWKAQVRAASKHRSKKKHHAK